MAKVFNIVLTVILAVGVMSSAWAQVTKDTLDQNADQSQGNYAATNLNYLGSGSLGMMQSAWKDPLQHMGEGQTRPGYTKYYWTPELVLPVRIREGMYTLINFPTWEIIENVYLGDGQSFTAEIQGPSSLMVYPEVSQFVGVDTNMIVFGRSGNKYVFYVQSETVNTDRITNAIIDIEVVNKNKGSGVIGNNGSNHINANGYVQSGSSMDATFTRNLQREDWIENIPVDPTKFRFDIEVYVPNPDDIIIAPERVWRDNIFTYIDLGEKALTAVQRPIVTLIVERSETPVGFRSAGPNNRLIIVEGMGDMVLRSGKRIVCLKLRRADSDGLENTVYAKTNEWDLQTAYASNPTGNNNSESINPETGLPFEDVYGSGTESNPKTVNGNIDFFSENSFSAPVNGSNSGNTNANPSTAAVGKTPSASFDFNNLPKTEPKTGKEALTGQIDVQVNGAELVTPEYNNQQPSGISVSFPKNETTGSGGNVIGKSENNSNPILITAADTDKKSAKTNNNLVSAETDALIKEFQSGVAYKQDKVSNISIELGTDENVNNLEKLWFDISKRYSAAVGRYQPFYSVEAPADGQGKEVFHLRVGPVKSLEEGDNICSQLGRNGIFCSVVRIQ